MRKPVAVLFLIVAVTASAQETPRKMPRLISAEFIGCSGDPDDGYTTSTARRITSYKDNTSFLVSYISSCGQNGRDLKPSWKNGELDLTFDLYSPNDAYVMCDCEYWAKFTFGPDAILLPRVKVNGETPKLLGRWPEGR
jgi:hypothetical protein